MAKFACTGPGKEKSKITILYQTVDLIQEDGETLYLIDYNNLLSPS
jgi:hypothetical protein